jgi:hypothetical protein
VKKFRLLGLVGITWIAVAHAGWAAGHDGEGENVGGGGHLGAGSAGGLGAPHATTLGVGSRGGGVGFGIGRNSSLGSRSSFRPSVNPGLSSRPLTGRARLTTTGARSENRVTSTRNPAGPRPAAASNQSVSAPAARSTATVIASRGLNGRTDHIYARHDQNWHHDWDQHRAHYGRNHWWVYDGGSWIGLDAGFFPWDYYPYYAYDYYPYDYYPGFYSDVQPYYQDEGISDSAPAPDSTISAVQTELTQLGYYNGPVDGLFSALTRDALARYQINQQLTVTGSLSPDTMQSLGLPQMARDLQTGNGS